MNHTPHMVLTKNNTKLFISTRSHGHGQDLRETAERIAKRVDGRLFVENPIKRRYVMKNGEIAPWSRRWLEIKL